VHSHQHKSRVVAELVPYNFSGQKEELHTMQHVTRYPLPSRKMQHTAMHAGRMHRIDADNGDPVESHDRENKGENENHAILMGVVTCTSVGEQDTRKAQCNVADIHSKGRQ
jgi:hypothetical protein